MKNTFPILEFDAERSAIIEPQLTTRGIDIPDCCVITFFQDVVKQFSQKGIAKKIASQNTEFGRVPIFKFSFDSTELALMHPGVGAPFAAAMLEELIARGCKKFIVCGGAGALNRDMELGQILVPETAVRDEGTSYHYLPPAREVGASPAGVQAICKTLDLHAIPFHRTKTWTTDAIYRETRTRMLRRRAEGCSAVEMEAAALFAVAEFRNVTLAQMLYAGDNLGGEKWQGRGWTKQTSLREKMVWLSAEACLRIGN